MVQVRKERQEKPMYNVLVYDPEGKNVTSFPTASYPTLSHESSPVLNVDYIRIGDDERWLVIAIVDFGYYFVDSIFEDNEIEVTSSSHKLFKDIDTFLGEISNPVPRTSILAA